MLCFAGFELDEQRAELRGPDGAPIKLRRKSFDLLLLLATNSGRIVDKPDLMAVVWPNVHVADDSLFQCIRELRVAVGDDRRQLIKVIPGRGYMLDAEVTRPAQLEPVADAPTVLTNEIMKPPIARLWRRPWAIAATIGLLLIAGLAVGTPTLRPPPTPITLAVKPVVDDSGDPNGAATAAGVTNRLIDGLAGIDNIEVMASASAAPPAFVIESELRKDQDSWTLKTRLVESATGTVTSLALATVGRGATSLQLQQTRLAAAVGNSLARSLNTVLEGAYPASTSSKVAIEQATASITQTSRERFAVAQTMLKDALTAEPDNVDVQVALVGLQLRGIQMVWYDADERAAAEINASALLQRAIAARPRSIEVLEAQCRFLSATNAFAESLEACAQVLSFDPWDGSSLYLVGLGQLHLGRFADALATFEMADRYDTPSVSRWTWLLGAGWANLLLNRNAEAAAWLERSIVITPASGRSQMMLAVAYKRLGRIDDARAAMAKGMALRPASTVSNVMTPVQNASPIYVAAGEQAVQTMAELGLPNQ
jgi:DNA-binding winged helix-turn-helix (wHTH) protein/tetratricopeptide (TPR) repeat protein